MKRLVDRELDGLRELALRMGGLAEGILAKAWRSVGDRDVELARAVERDDLQIDRLELEIDDAVLNVLALQQPVARDLRQVIAIKTMAGDLERVGDLSRNIAKSASRLCEREPVPLPPMLEKLYDDCQRQLGRSLNCFAEADAEVARSVVAADDPIDSEEEQIVREAIEEISVRPDRSAQEVELILIAKNLERVADHATNIAEEVVLMAEARNLKHAAKLSRVGNEESPCISREPQASTKAGRGRDQ